MNDNIYELKSKLDNTDFQMLHKLYLFRCLTIKQVYNNFYISKISNFNKFIDTKLQELVKYELIEEVLFNKDNIALFLTKTGVELVKDVYDFPIEVFDEIKKQIKKGYYRASELRLLPRLIPHQIYLNQFILDFEKIYNHRDLEEDWQYYDEKYVSQYSVIRPDGLIRLANNDFFLEMDMGTENKNQLIDKWKHYRAFLSSTEYSRANQKITVLFILENVSNIENRKNIVKLTASQILLDSFDSSFNILIGTKEELLKKIFNNILPNLNGISEIESKLKDILASNHSFQVSKGNVEKLKSLLNNVEYGYYIRKTDSENNIIIENGRYQEFLLDYYRGDELSVINRISYLNKYSSTFKYYGKRDISYIVVVDDLNKLHKELDLYNLKIEKDVFYTTIQRLNMLPFSRALCQFDNLGRVYSFTSNALITRYYEEKETL